MSPYPGARPRIEFHPVHGLEQSGRSASSSANAFISTSMRTCSPRSRIRCRRSLSLTIRPRARSCCICSSIAQRPLHVVTHALQMRLKGGLPLATTKLAKAIHRLAQVDEVRAEAVHLVLHRAVRLKCRLVLNRLRPCRRSERNAGGGEHEAYRSPYAEHSSDSASATVGRRLPSENCCCCCVSISPPRRQLKTHDFRESAIPGSAPGFSARHLPRPCPDRAPRPSLARTGWW